MTATSLRQLLRPRLVAPVLTVAAAGCLGVLSGMPLSSATDDGSGVALAAADSRSATLTVTDLDPGDQVTRTVTIANDVAEQARLTFTETGAPAGYADGRLELRIEDDGREVYDGPFGGLGDYPVDMGWLEAGGSATYTFTVSLPDDAPLVPAGTQSATASYSWVTG